MMFWMAGALALCLPHKEELHTGAMRENQTAELSPACTGRPEAGA